MSDKKTAELKYLPAKYIQRMEELLGSDAKAFFLHYGKQPEPGLRINPLKTSIEDVSVNLDYELEALPWGKDGYKIRTSESAPGLHLYHAAGLYYIQEPAAQVVAELLDPQPGERVLDLAAAPGGKTTHIAGLMKNQGLLLANEISSKRVWDLAKNMERWGARNVVIANESP
jgi:16S rRNA C967 or C1407 C5-methylase (RsmB/RsmF family)